MSSEISPPSHRSFARVRVDEDAAVLLERVLYEAQGRLVQEKIAIREAGGDEHPERKKLRLIRRLIQETHRAMEDLGIREEDSNES